MDAPVLVVVVLVGGTLKNVGGPLYVCANVCMCGRMCVLSHLHFQGVGRCLGLWAGHWRISVGGPPTRRKAKDLKKSLTVETDELPFPKRPAENKFKTPQKQKLDFIFFPAPLYFLFRRGRTGGIVLVLVFGWY